MLARYIERTTGITVDLDSIFDAQVKRFHLYKRQTLNILHVLHQYLQLRDHPEKTIIPHTYLFAGKAAASYGEAKETIRLINVVARLVNSDPRVSRLMKVVFLENYDVSLAQLIIPATDVSEQISTAGKEASGTGNMKFMMNGAITLGTMDGANVEIHREVGDDNCVIFGLRAEEVMAFYHNGNYSSWSLYAGDPDIHRLMDDLVNLKLGGEHFGMLYDSFLDRNDEYFVLKDFKPYCAAQEEIDRRYKDQKGWRKSSAINIAHSGYFSTDRTIRQYAEDIWHIKPVGPKK